MTDPRYAQIQQLAQAVPEDSIVLVCAGDVEVVAHVTVLRLASSVLRDILQDHASETPSTPGCQRREREETTTPPRLTVADDDPFGWRQTLCILYPLVASGDHVHKVCAERVASGPNPARGPTLSVALASKAAALHVMAVM